MRVKGESEKAGLKLNIKKLRLWHPGPITSWQIGEKVEAMTDFIFLVSKIIGDVDCSHEIKRRLLLGRKTMTNLDSILKSKDITLPTKIHMVKAMIFPLVMYGCESWMMRKAESQLMLLNCGAEKTLESPLDFKKIQPVHPKGNQPWIFFGRTVVETPIPWPPDGKSWLISKDLDVGKEWRQKEVGEAEDEMVI